MPKAIIVLDDGQDFNMYPMTGILLFTAVVSLLLLLFKVAAVGHFAHIGWWIVAIPFSIVGFLMLLASIRR